MDSYADLKDTDTLGVPVVGIRALGEWLYRNGWISQTEYERTARDREDRRPVDSADLVEAKPQQDLGKPGFGCHLPAKPHVDPRGMAGLHRGQDATQDGRMKGLVKVADPAVPAVHGERVLDQVVGSDAEEIAFGSQ